MENGIYYITLKSQVFPKGHYKYGKIKIENNQIVGYLFDNNLERLNKANSKSFYTGIPTDMWELRINQSNILNDSNILIFTKETHPEFFI